MLPREQDERWMRRAFDLARRGEGLTRPNPPVGAVLVKAGRIVGEGYHRKAGTPHAEVHALAEAGARARGATLYVTLEPCSTHGRTPPCTDAIRWAGISRVVYASVDPNPSHAGRARAILRRAGIEVLDGVLAAEGTRLIAPFASWMRTKRPLVTLKLAATFDGRIADARGRSKWITGSSARDAVQALRRSADAILIGSGTAVSDNPSLLPRPAAGRRPYRVVVDSRGVVPTSLHMFRDSAAARTVIATTARSSREFREQVASTGAAVMLLPARRGHVSLVRLMRELGRMGILHVLCEGGGELAGALLRDGLVDRIEWFCAARFLGEDAVPAVKGLTWPLASAPGFAIRAVEQLGDDVWIRAERAV